MVSLYLVMIRGLRRFTPLFSSDASDGYKSQDLLLAECSLPDAMAMREHLTPRQAGQLAAQAVARRLVLTHFYPPVDVVDILGDVAQYYTGPTVLATDGWSIEF